MLRADGLHVVVLRRLRHERAERAVDLREEARLVVLLVILILLLGLVRRPPWRDTGQYDALVYCRRSR